jgi:hypothetical protein
VVDLKKEFSNLIAKTAARTLLGREIREQLFDQVSICVHTDARAVAACGHTAAVLQSFATLGEHVLAACCCMFSLWVTVFSLLRGDKVMTLTAAAKMPSQVVWLPYTSNMTAITAPTNCLYYHNFTPPLPNHTPAPLQVDSLLHDLDDGMRPISVFFPYLPTSFHKKRDLARIQLGKIFAKVRPGGSSVRSAVNLVSSR